jgi:hypothetical protein
VDVTTDQAEPSRGAALHPSVGRLTAAFLLSGVVCGLIAGIAYTSLVAFALLVGVGIPVTVCLGVVLAVKAQQATVLLVTGWRPTVLRLALAALPAAAVAFGLEQWVRWGPWPASGVVVVVGLVTQALVLYALVAGETHPPA